MSVASWGGRPLPEPLDECSDPDCVDCRAIRAVIDAGAAVICEAAGGEWDAVDDEHVRAHYRKIADDVFTRMSDALVETGIVQVADHG